MPDNAPGQYLATAIEAVIHAGAIQMAHFGGDFHVSKKSTIDLVTEVDIEIERGFRAMIADRFPHHVVLGEEFEREGDRSRVPEFCWVYDPVDGTTNYAHGLPIFCSSLALEIEGVATVGAVYDPSRKELFTAMRGAGAWLNGAPLHVSGAEALIDSLLVTGFPYSVQQSPDRFVAMFSAFLQSAQAVRRLGSAALDLCYVAAGRFDGFWEQLLNPWDMAAGALIVQEAGGSVTTLTGEPFQSRAGSVLATNRRIHAPMLGVIHEVLGRR